MMFLRPQHDTAYECQSSTTSCALYCSSVGKGRQAFTTARALRLTSTQSSSLQTASAWDSLFSREGSTGGWHLQAERLVHEQFGADRTFSAAALLVASSLLLQDPRSYCCTGE